MCQFSPSKVYQYPLLTVPMPILAVMLKRIRGKVVIGLEIGDKKCDMYYEIQQQKNAIYYRRMKFGR